MKERIIEGADLYNKVETLKVVQVDSVNWKTYYVDEKTGEKWVEEYLYPEMQAGGPPQLRQISSFPWEANREIE